MTSVTDGWADVLGHQEVVERFRRALGRNRLASTFLFVGPPGVGKRLFARRLAQCLLCESHSAAELNCCLTCNACRQVAAGTHPDLILLEKSKDASVIKLEQLVGTRDDRMQSGFCHEIALRPSAGRYRVAIIDSADDLNVEGANALLKTLEEPPAHSLLILLSSSAQKQLPTIRSRAQIIRFQPLREEEVKRLLLQTGLTDVEEQAAQAAKLSGGSLETAQEWFEEEAHQFRAQWLAVLADPARLASEGGRLLTDWIQAAGKDNWRRRNAMRNAVHVALSLYRCCLLLEHAAEPPADDELRHAAHTLTTETRRLGSHVSSPTLLTIALERSLVAEQQIAANANVNAWGDAWIADLARITQGRWLDPTRLDP